MVRQKVILDMLIFKNIYENDFEGLGDVSILFLHPNVKFIINTYRKIM